MDWKYVILAIVAVYWSCVALPVVLRFVLRLLRHKKGELRISVTQGQLGKGCKITGEVKVTAHGPIESQKLVLSLVAENFWREKFHVIADEFHVVMDERGADEWSNEPEKREKDYSVEVFRKEKVVVKAVDYRMGESREFKFSISSPKVKELEGLRDRCGTDRQMILWYLDARLYATGVDLRIREKLSGPRSAEQELQRAKNGGP